MAEELDLDPEECKREQFAETFAGNQPIPGSSVQTYAMRYGGHQFGNWAGVLLSPLFSNSGLCAGHVGCIRAHMLHMYHVHQVCGAKHSRAVTRLQQFQIVTAVLKESAACHSGPQEYNSDCKSTYCRLANYAVIPCM